MSKQAKILTAQELRCVLDYVATRQQAARNRAMLLVTHTRGYPNAVLPLLVQAGRD